MVLCKNNQWWNQECSHSVLFLRKDIFKNVLKVDAFDTIKLTVKLQVFHLIEFTLANNQKGTAAPLYTVALTLKTTFINTE